MGAFADVERLIFAIAEIDDIYLPQAELIIRQCLRCAPISKRKHEPSNAESRSI